MLPTQLKNRMIHYLQRLFQNTHNNNNNTFTKTSSPTSSTTTSYQNTKDLSPPSPQPPSPPSSSNNNSNENSNSNSNSSGRSSNSKDLHSDFNLFDDEYYHLEQTDIVVIDFGGATFDDKHHTSVVCSRPYRPPEIILGNGWSYPCDMWGIGCILVELYTGATLFDTHSNRQHLAMMERVIGPLPQHLTQNSKKYYPTGEYLDWKHDEDTRSLEKVNSMRGLVEYFHPEHQKLLDLISKLLEYQPSKRLSACDALNHPFFHEKIDNDLFYYK
ncbi:protein serine/threonine kinase [Heterostelium album PN500]|uniref:Protein serine/threonine kinase n=1 Tax=Heterostelium pallidum (strain ATCC 26659 / Pp 5 / PN500) TaxID=670386 RepID=D3BIG3_HETP5|nr:protein serine/threonine kinase [Heterostelium album PN500]EFA79063.1 protein serine/threonine kinase [Heterostelium album PN500]|eukprot:XP_020431186.1 protein serine/threonine kinase [Heterostelium album PN500]